MVLCSLSATARAKQTNHTCGVLTFIPSQRLTSATSIPLINISIPRSALEKQP